MNAYRLIAHSVNENGEGDGPYRWRAELDRKGSKVCCGDFDKAQDEGFVGFATNYALEPGKTAFGFVIKMTDFYGPDDYITNEMKISFCPFCGQKIAFGEAKRLRRRKVRRAVQQFVEEFTEVPFDDDDDAEGTVDGPRL